MENSKHVVVGLAVGLLVLLGGAWLIHPSVSVSPTPVNVNVPASIAGAVTSPDIPSPYIRFGGEGLWANRSTSFTTGSTTLCVFQAPQNASSTLVKVGIDVLTGTGTAQTIAIYKSNSRYTQTTLLAQDAIASNVLGNVIATSTALDTKFGKNNWVVITDTANSLPPQATAPSGSCSVVWSEI